MCIAVYSNFLFNTIIDPSGYDYCYNQIAEIHFSYGCKFLDPAGEKHYVIDKSNFLKYPLSLPPPPPCINFRHLDKCKIRVRILKKSLHKI